MPSHFRVYLPHAFVSMVSVAMFAACGAMQSPEQGEYDYDTEMFAATSSAISASKKSSSGESLCLDAKDNSQASGTQVQLWECVGSVNQGFRYAGGALKVFDNLCLSVANARDKNGTSVRLKTCDASKVSQQWKREGQAFRWANTNKCLDITDGDFENGSLLQIWSCSGDSDNQSFSTNGFGDSAGVSKGSIGNNATPYGTRIDVSKWRQETYASGTFNNEQQRYTDKNQNVHFNADGSFVITAKKDGNGKWTSARLTGDEVGSLPAYFEATITLPRGKGTWPAFWLTSRGAWPQGGEIDIMEQINGDGDTHWSNHWGSKSGNPTYNTHEKMGGLDLSKPHRYGGYITKDGVQFYVDGKAVGKWSTYPSASNFPSIASKMVPIVNLAMGGNWPGNTPASTGPQVMTVHAVTRASSPPK